MPHERKSVLALGLKGPVAGAAITAQDVQARVAAEVKRLDAVGFELVPHVMEPGDGNALGDVRKLLQGSRWDGVSIGYGLRANKEFTALFEALVNMVFECCGAGTQMLFALGKIGQAVERRFLGVEVSED